VPHDRDETGAALETAIRDLLAQRSEDATVCPSEAARAVGGDDWRDLMQPARSAAGRLSDRGETVVTQGGKVVDPATATGPIRIGRAR
jgi:hypothetical protein